MIIKAAIAELKDALSGFDVYEKEVEFYDKIAPRMNEKLKDLDESELLPECFGVCKKQKIMVIEDLNAKGYKLLPGQNKCNISETKAVLKRMAVFNAIGAILQQEQSDIFATFKSGLYNEFIKYREKVDSFPVAQHLEERTNHVHLLIKRIF